MYQSRSQASHSHLSNPFSNERSEEDGGAGLATPSGAPQHSPVLPPLSPLPKDDESMALEFDVEAASRRVAALRAAMQDQLQAQLADKLAAARPSATLTPPREGETAALDAEDAAPPLSPAAEELGARLEAALGAFPALLARLGEAGARLDKVAAAAQADAAAARQPPNTIRKAVLGDGDGDDDDEAEEEAEMSGAAQEGAGEVEVVPTLAEGVGE
jgi:hypothetical protein